MNNQQYSPTGFRLLPPVVKNLLIINGLLYLATVTFRPAFQIDLTDILGLHYFGSEKFRSYQIITYMFMHGSFTHLFFNMFAVWMFGNVLENYWGPKRFLTYYLVTGIGAVLIHYVIQYFTTIGPVVKLVNQYIENPSVQSFNEFLNSQYFKVSSYEIQNHYNTFIQSYNSLIGSHPREALQKTVEFMYQYKADYLNAPVVVGASGAIFGVLLAFGMLFPNSLIYIYFAIPIKAKWFVVLYGAIELYSGIANNPGDNVAHFAHLGGMLFGFFLIKYWKRKIY